MFGKITDYDLANNNKYILTKNNIKITFNTNDKGHTYWMSSYVNPSYFIGKELTFLVIRKPDESFTRIDLFNIFKPIKDMEVDALWMQIISERHKNKIICKNILLITGQSYRKNGDYPKINISVELERKKCLEK